MKLTELLEQDREKLMRALSAAQTRDEAKASVERTLERMLFAFNDEARTQRQRMLAAAMVAAVKASLGLLDCVGEPKLWETKRPRARLGLPALAALLLGCVLCLGTGGWMLFDGRQPLAALLPVLGGALLVFAGAGIAKARGGAPERKIEVPTDWDRVWRTLHAAALVMDQALEDAASEERWEARRAAAEAPALSEAEAELTDALLEGLYGGDGEYALEKLAAVRRYLKEKGVDVVEYDEQHAQMFDRMPGVGTDTLRPALTQGGTLLRRGLATVPEH